MDYLSSWISNIILFIFLAVIVDMLLPNSSLQKYAKMVIGLLLITIILTPIMKLFSEDVDAWLKQLPIVTENEEKKYTSLTFCIYFKTNGCPIRNGCKGGING